MMPAPPATPRRDRLAFLDGLRGIAAICVVVYHVGTRFGGIGWIPNGYLAVDFFFVLSGLVIAVSYERRLATTLTFRAFVHRRLERLAPMAIAGVLLGTLYLLLRLRVQPGLSDPLGAILLAGATNLLLLPKLWSAPATTDELFPANGVLWTLFLELAVNLVWARCLVGSGMRVIAALAAAGGLLFLVVALRFDSTDVGWRLVSLSGGFGRVCYGFLAGVAIARLRHRLAVGRAVTHPAAPWIGLALIVTAVALPIANVGWLLFAALVMMPLAVLLGLGAGTRRILPAEELLGRLSYPLYAIHVPLLMAASGAQKMLAPGANLAAIAPWLLPPILLATWLALVCYDEPVRAWLARRALQARSAPLTGAAPVPPPSSGGAPPSGRNRPC